MSVEMDTKAQTDRVSLRLHHGGQLVKEPESNTWRYVGGATFNDTLPCKLSYSDLCVRMNAKVGEPCSIRYLSPGDALQPEALVNVTDDDDLQELYNEYKDALARAGSGSPTLRIHVFLQAALQFEIAQEPEEDTISLNCYDGPIDFNDYVGDDEEEDEYSSGSHSSCGPSSDTAWQQFSGLYAGYPPSYMPDWTTTGTTASGYPPCTYGADSQIGCGMFPGPNTTGLPDQAAAAGLEPDLPEQETAGYEQQDVQDKGDHDDYGIMGQWVAEESRALYNKPLDRVRDAAGGLPSHISAFGDAANSSKGSKGRGSGAALLLQCLGQGLNLPSHISAFGDGTATAGAKEDVVMHGDGDDRQAARVGDETDESTLPAEVTGNTASVLTQDFDFDATPTEQLDTLLPYGLPTSRSADGISEDAKDQNDEVGAGPSVEAAVPQQQDATAPLPAQKQAENMIPAGLPEAVQQQLNAVQAIQQQQQNAIEQAQGVAVDVANAAAATAPLHGNMAQFPASKITGMERIGEGAFGEVSKADVFPYGTIAIKWLRREKASQYSDSFNREIELLARLNHPNITRIFGTITDDSAGAAKGNAGGGNSGGGSAKVAGFFMEYLKGGSLTQRLKAVSAAGQRLSLKERCIIARQASLGMAYLHQQTPPVIHFDFKTDNLLVDGEGESIVVKVGDFGLSKHKIQSQLAIQDMRGTIPYMAPEMVIVPRKVCEKCDVWSMGVVLWEMFTMVAPFHDKTTNQIIAHLKNDQVDHLQMPHGMEAEWQQMIFACTERDPANRPTFMQLAERFDDMRKRAEEQAANLQQQAANLVQQQQQLLAVTNNVAPLQQGLIQAAARQMNGMAQVAHPAAMQLQREYHQQQALQLHQGQDYQQQQLNAATALAFGQAPRQNLITAASNPNLQQLFPGIQANHAVRDQMQGLQVALFGNQPHQASPFGNTDLQMQGLQASAFGNTTEVQLYGLQVAPFGNRDMHMYGDDDMQLHGMQAAWIADGQNHVRGFQAAQFGYGDNQLHGFGATQHMGGIADLQVLGNSDGHHLHNLQAAGRTGNAGAAAVCANAFMRQGTAPHGGLGAHFNVGILPGPAGGGYQALY